MISQPSHSDRPRNRRAVARGARTRETIRQLMLQHAERCPLARPLSGKELQHLLRDRGVYLALSTVLWHVAHVRLAADIERLDAELGCKGSNSSGPTAPLS